MLNVTMLSYDVVVTVLSHGFTMFMDPTWQSLINKDMSVCLSVCSTDFSELAHRLFWYFA